MWNRIEGFRASDASGLLSSRELVRIALQRSTIHLVSARLPVDAAAGAGGDGADDLGTGAVPGRGRSDLLRFAGRSTAF
ncbi:hypothetical protein [Nonomuraea sp. NPDC048916]|uniref:DNA glycosylase AlkZ-like family protein n=1 Tax=Nonomuraea sp. NPDC048916 TaxID=3154232 RepID=UPI0033C813F2